MSTKSNQKLIEAYQELGTREHDRATFQLTSLKKFIKEICKDPHEEKVLTEYMDETINTFRLVSRIVTVLLQEKLMPGSLEAFEVAVCEHNKKHENYTTQQLLDLHSNPEKIGKDVN